MAVQISVDQTLIVLFLGLLAWAAVSDALSFRIPNAATVGIALLYPLHALASPAQIDWLGALITAAILFAVGLFIFVRGAAGGGDVKLLSASALWAGLHLILPLLIVMGLVGGLLALTIWLRQYVRRFRTAGLAGLMIPDSPDARIDRVPYGIAIAAGAASTAIQLLMA